MSEHAAPTRARQTAAPQPAAKSELRLQRKCACGRHTADGAECAGCKAKRASLQRWSMDRPAPAAMLRGAERMDAGPVVTQGEEGRDFVDVAAGDAAAAARTGRGVRWVASALGATVAGAGAASSAKGWAGRGQARLRDAYPSASRRSASVDADAWARATDESADASPEIAASTEATAPGSIGAMESASTAEASGATSTASPVTPSAIPSPAPSSSTASTVRTGPTMESNVELGEMEEREMEEAASPPPIPHLLFDDGADGAQPGQMGRGEFLARLQAEITRAAEAELAGTGRTTDGCPYLGFWFGYYARRTSRQIERSLHRYAPEAAGVRSASEAIPLVAARVGRAVATWARTGEVTGVPSGLPAGGMRAPGLSRRQAATGTGNVFGPVQLKAREGGPRAVEDPAAIQAQLGDGRPLDGGVRTRMEGAFGQGLGPVHLHTGATATRLAGELNARAFTVGRHVAFADGQYRPGTPAGDALIAHEMVHVIQQRGGTEEGLETGSARYDALEGDADRAATGVVARLWGGAQERARAAIPTLRSGLRLQRCGTFSEHSSERRMGYDESADPDSLVVPVGDKRKVKVRKKEELTFVVNPAGAVTVDATTPSDGVTITGVNHGQAFVEAHAGTEIRERLDVAAKRQRSITVDYHFVSDSTGRSTRRHPGDETAMNNRLNEVWEKQANVHFSVGLVDSPVVPRTLGTEIEANNTGDPEWQAVTAFATGAPYNVFFVWEIADPPDGDIQGVTAGTGGHTFLEDDECADHLTNAHEAGHHLGLANGDSHPSSSIMASCGGSNRDRVTRAQADAVNP